MVARLVFDEQQLQGRALDAPLVEVLLQLLAPGLGVCQLLPQLLGLHLVHPQALLGQLLLRLLQPRRNVLHRMECLTWFFLL